MQTSRHIAWWGGERLGDGGHFLYFNVQSATDGNLGQKENERTKDTKEREREREGD